MRSKGNTDIKIQHKKANTNSISFQKIARFHKNEIQRQYRYITNNTWTPTQTQFHSTEITRYHKNEIQRQYWYKKKHKKANTNSISFQRIARFHKNEIQRQYRYKKTTQESQHKFDLIPKINTLSQKCDPKAIQIYKKTTHEHLHKLTSTQKR